MTTFNTLASAEAIEKTKQALEAAGMDVIVAADGVEAKARALELIPEGAEVMTMTSMTGESIGLYKELQESGKYNNVRATLGKPETSASEKRKLGGGADYTVGSVHALTQDGKLMIASNTGSQLGAYAYGAGKMIFVIGAQKIVANVDDGMRRIYEYVLPLESERANKAYHITTGSFVSKLLIIHREVAKARITVIIANESLGF